jgi:hypothetical protein
MPTKTITFPTLEGGMNTTQSPTTLSAGQTQWIENLHWQHGGGWSSEEGGFTRRNSAPLNNGASIASLYTFHDATASERTLIQAGNLLYYVNPLQGEVYQMLGQTATAPNQYIPFMGWCYVLNSSSAPQRWNGNTPGLETASGWPPVLNGLTCGYPGFGCVYANRLVLAGDSLNPHMLYLSALENPEMFTPGELEDGAGAIQVNPGDGQRITALMPLYVPYSNEHVLLIFKSSSIYALRGYDASSFQLELVSNTLGTESPRSLMAVGQDVWFMSRTGIHALGPNTESGILAVGNISQPMMGRWPRINLNSLDKSFALHDMQRRELWWCLPTGSANTANEVWVQHYGTVPHQWSLKTGMSMTDGHTLPDGQLLTGTSNGYWVQQRRGNTYQGVPYSWKLITATHALGSFSTHSRLILADVFLNHVINGGLNVSITWELGLAGTLPLTPAIHLGYGEAHIYGMGVYGVSSYLEQTRAVARVYPEGSGRLVELTFSGQSVSQPITITGYSLKYNEGGSSI